MKTESPMRLLIVLVLLLACTSSRLHAQQSIHMTDQFCFGCHLPLLGAMVNACETKDIHVYVYGLDAKHIVERMNKRLETTVFVQNQVHSDVAEMATHAGFVVIDSASGNIGLQRDAILDLISNRKTPSLSEPTHIPAAYEHVGNIAQTFRVHDTLLMRALGGQEIVAVDTKSGAASTYFEIGDVYKLHNKHLEESDDTRMYATPRNLTSEIECMLYADGQPNVVITLLDTIAVERDAAGALSGLSSSGMRHDIFNIGNAGDCEFVHSSELKYFDPIYSPVNPLSSSRFLVHKQSSGANDISYFSLQDGSLTTVLSASAIDSLVLHSSGNTDATRMENFGTNETVQVVPTGDSSFWLVDMRGRYTVVFDGTSGEYVTHRQQNLHAIIEYVGAPMFGRVIPLETGAAIPLAKRMDNNIRFVGMLVFDEYYQPIYFVPIDETYISVIPVENSRNEILVRDESGEWYLRTTE